MTHFPRHLARPGWAVLCASILLVAPALGAGRFIEMKNGYFWDPAAANYWVPHGFAYQTINPPVFATQTPEQIEYDFLEMRKLHADSLRVDFTWGYIEPTNDVFSWTATDHLIATAEKYGFRMFVLIGYQYPPGWFSNDWKAVNQSNQVSNIVNYEHPLARAAYTDFIARVTGRYKDSPAVAGWILGNEYAYFDLWEAYDPHLFVGYDTNYSLPAFRAYLTNLYAGSITALNANWNTAYGSFSEVPMPTNYPGVQNPGDVNSQDRYYPAYHDLIQWRKKSIGDFVAIGAVAARNADTNHLRSYSMVGGIYSGFDANNTCEDAKTIVARCAAAGAGLDFWSINNYPWASEGNELRTAQFGITKYRDQSGLPVLVTETGLSSSENLFPGAAERQAPALPGAVWEALMAGAIGVHIFTWNDRPFTGAQIREAGFGVIQTNRLIKNPVYWNVLEIFRRMEQLNVNNLFGASRNPASDIYFYWSSDADLVWGRANQENCMLWGGLKRLGYEPGFIDESGLDSGIYTNARALLLSHAFMMQSNRIAALTNVIAAGVNIHANGVLPGRYDQYHRSPPAWVGVMSNVFGLSAAAATNYWHGGIAGSWEQPYSGIFLRYLTTLGPLTPAYTWTNVTTWIRSTGYSAISGTTVVESAFDYWGLRTQPGLHIKGHGALGRAAINTFTLGDSVDMWWLSPKSKEMVWQLHYDWGRAIYRDWFGMQPALDLSGSGYFYVLPDYRICTNGSVLISLLNESSNAVTVTVTASNLIQGKTVERLSSAAGVLQTNSSGQISVTLAGDEFVLLYAYTNNMSLANASEYKIWLVNEPAGGIWPNGRTISTTIGYDTRGATLDLYLALESLNPTVERARTNWFGVSGTGTNTLALIAPNADLGNTNYISSPDGGQFQLHAWLQNGASRVSECSLPTRLAWGAKPTSIPSSVTTGTTYQVTVNWQELPSYQSSEIPTPLSRAAVWQPSMRSNQIYTVYLDLMTGNVAIVSTNMRTVTGTSSNRFSVTVPGGYAGPFWWRARTLTGALTGPTTNNHDFIDSFEDRGRGDSAALLAPWTTFAYAQYNNATIYAQGVNDMAAEGTNGAFMAVGIPNPNGWAGFGMYYEYASAWSLPAVSQYSNITFAFSFKETNGFTGTMEMKVEDTTGGALSYTKAYTGTAWSNISATLNLFTGSVNTGAIKKLTVLLQAAQRGVTYLGVFDNIRFTGTPATVTPPPAANEDQHTSFEDLSRGAYVNPAPWALNSYNSGTENNYVIHGVDAVASDGVNGFFAVYKSHTNVAGYSGFYLQYNFANAPILPADLSQAGLRADFMETNGRACTLELQLKSAGGISKYTNTYAHTPGGWYTIGANLAAFTGTADLNRLTEMIILCQMNTPGGLEYVAHFDNIWFTGTVSSVSAPNGLYLSIDDTPANSDRDGDGILDIYETHTGVYNGPTDTGTDPDNPDTDGDRQNDGDEVIAGTDPNNPTSVFEVESVTQAGAAGMIIEWFARTNKVYSIHYANGSLVTNGFAPLGGWTNIVVTADGLTNIVDTAAAGLTNRFYRIGVRRP